MLLPTEVAMKATKLLCDITKANINPSIPKYAAVPT